LENKIPSRVLNKGGNAAHTEKPLLGLRADWDYGGEKTEKKKRKAVNSDNLHVPGFHRTAFYSPRNAPTTPMKKEEDASEFLVVNRGRNQHKGKRKKVTGWSRG